MYLLSSITFVFHLDATSAMVANGTPVHFMRTFWPFGPWCGLNCKISVSVRIWTLCQDESVMLFFTVCMCVCVDNSILM